MYLIHQINLNLIYIKKNYLINIYIKKAPHIYFALGPKLGGVGPALIQPSQHKKSLIMLEKILCRI